MEKFPTPVERDNHILANLIHSAMSSSEHASVSIDFPATISEVSKWDTKASLAVSGWHVVEHATDHKDRIRWIISPITKHKT